LINEVPHESGDARSKGEQVRERPEWSLEVSHLSPFGLRFELEELVLRVGECVNDAHWLHAQRPELYWGIIWYSNRCSLPSGFSTVASADVPSSSGLQKIFESPVVVGWRESVVRAQAHKILSGDDKEVSGIISGLNLIDLFPSCSAEEVNTLRIGVSDKMDGSPAGMRGAMLTLCGQCRSLFASGPAFEMLTLKQKSQSTARTIYVTLLTLYFYFQKHVTTSSGHFAAPTASATVAASDLMKGLTKVDMIFCTHPAS
jgi:hypothetical protein